MRNRAKYLAATAAALIALATPFMVAAQTSREYAPKLADIMSGVQFRHLKLSIAGQQQNWKLAAYELELLKSGLVDAITFYRNIPVSNIEMIDGPIEAIDGAIAARSSAAFAKAFRELTTGCNSCHQSIGRDFIAITVPTASPFSNQSFSPPKADGKDSARR